MHGPAGGDPDDEPYGDEGRPEAIDSEVEVTCPHCGEGVVVTLDPGGGAVQDYVEDCEVCCRPWHVHVQYDGGRAEVTVDQA